MEYKSKYTASEIDARLSQVFDSTLQTKEVEVSEDTTIKADEGFLGLKEVNVKVSGGGDPASSWKYYDIAEIAVEYKQALAEFALLVKVMWEDGGGMVSTAAALMTLAEKVTAFAFDANARFHNGSATMADLWAQMSEMYLSLGATEITESEFYAL